MDNKEYAAQRSHEISTLNENSFLEKLWDLGSGLRYTDATELV